MNEGSLLKRTLVVTGALVGISTAWVALVSVVLVALVGHATSPSSSATETSAQVVPAPTAASHETSARARGLTNVNARTTTKPNG